MPLGTAVSRDPSVASPTRFMSTLATRWQVPPAVGALAHERAPVAPAGRVALSAGGPVDAYDALALVWPEPARDAQAEGAPAPPDPAYPPRVRSLEPLVGAAAPLTPHRSPLVAAATGARGAPAPVVPVEYGPELALPGPQQDNRAGDYAPPVAAPEQQDVQPRRRWLGGRRARGAPAAADASGDAAAQQDSAGRRAVAVPPAGDSAARAALLPSLVPPGPAPQKGGDQTSAAQTSAAQTSAAQTSAAQTGGSHASGAPTRGAQDPVRSTAVSSTRVSPTGVSPTAGSPSPAAPLTPRTEAAAPAPNPLDTATAPSATAPAAHPAQSPASPPVLTTGSEGAHFGVPEWFDTPPAPGGPAAVPAPTTQAPAPPPAPAVPGSQPTRTAPVAAVPSEPPAPSYESGHFGVPAWFGAVPASAPPSAASPGGAAAPGVPTAPGGPPRPDRHDGHAPSEEAGHFGVPEWFDNPPPVAVPATTTSGRPADGWVDHDGNWYPAPGEAMENPSAYPAAYLRDPQGFRAEHEDVSGGDDGEEDDGDGSYDRRPTPAPAPALPPTALRPGPRADGVPPAPPARPASVTRRRPTYRLGPAVLPAAPVPAAASAPAAVSALLDGQREPVDAELTAPAVAPPVGPAEHLPHQLTRPVTEAASGSMAAQAQQPSQVVAPAPEQDLDVLAARLYDRIRSRLRAELLIDRERSNLLTDLR